MQQVNVDFIHRLPEAGIMSFEACSFNVFNMWYFQHILASFQNDTLWPNLKDFWANKKNAIQMFEIFHQELIRGDILETARVIRSQEIVVVRHIDQIQCLELSEDVE